MTCDRGTFAALEAVPETGACELGTALLVPGYTGSKEDFLPVLGELAAGGRRVVAIDQRGQYETPGPDDPAAYDLAELGNDVAALLAATRAVHLLGHSFGGLVAREALLSKEAPVASITLMSSGPGALPGARAAELRSFLDTVAAAAGPEELRAIVDAIWHKSRKPQAIAAGVAPGVIDFLQARMLGNSATGLVAMAGQLLRAPDLTEDLAKLGIPVFVLYGENDDAWPAGVQEEMAALLQARRECIPGAGHSPAVDAPATTAHALTDFWNSVELFLVAACRGWFLALEAGVAGAIVARMDARIERVWPPEAAEGDEATGDGAEANAWIIGDDEEVIVIDPGKNAAAILKAVGERDVLAVICTHGHAAHVGAAVEVAERDESPVALHKADRQQWRAVHDDDPEIEMDHGGTFDVADVTLAVIHTPGHSKGFVSLYCPELEVVFTGDALIAGGPVPHDGDFPDFPRQLNSIGEHLLDLPSGTRVLPGHGEESTIGTASKRFDGWVSAGPGDHD